MKGHLVVTLWVKILWSLLGSQGRILQLVELYVGDGLEMTGKRLHQYCSSLPRECSLILGIRSWNGRLLGRHWGETAWTLFRSSNRELFEAIDFSSEMVLEWKGSHQTLGKGQHEHGSGLLRQSFLELYLGFGLQIVDHSVVTMRERDSAWSLLGGNWFSETELLGH